MNFIDFLNQSNNNTIKNNNSTNFSEKEKFKKPKKLTKQFDDTITVDKFEEHFQDKNDTNTYHYNLKIGDIVQIIYKPNSDYNSYKGYIGEIKDYKKDKDYALVFLYAVVQYKVVKFPLSHFILYDKNNK